MRAPLAPGPLPEAANFLVAEIDGVVVGMIAVHQLNDGSVQLSHAFVDPAHRRRGVGATLIEAAAARAGAAEIAVIINRDNSASWRFWHRLCFKRGKFVVLRRLALHHP